jgi:hypothetical protein
MIEKTLTGEMLFMLGSGADLHCGYADNRSVLQAALPSTPLNSTSLELSHTCLVSKRILQVHLNALEGMVYSLVSFLRVQEFEIYYPSVHARSKN